jgi:hypothetical protein
MKNKITYITYATGEKYINASKNIFDEEKIFFDNSILYNIADIDNEFYIKNKKIFDSSRGAGYWLWKPYLILKTMEKIDYGDIVFYLDLGDCLFSDISDFVRETIIKNNGYFLVDGYYVNKNWTKNDCFNLMNCQDKIYLNSLQLEAGCCGFQKDDKVISFLNEWLFFCSNYQIVSDEIVLSNPNYFNEHRYDQSILTNLKIKYNLKSLSIHEIHKFITYNKYF